MKRSTVESLMYKVSCLFILITGLLFSSCQSENQDPHSLPFDYDYAGILPCADCSGILVHLGFDHPRSRSFYGQYRTVYQGTINGNQIESEEVPIQLDSNWIGANGSSPKIVLILNPEDSATRTIYEWNEERVELLNREGEKIEGSMSYTLKRQGSEGI